MTCAWDQLPEEPDEAYEAFLEYLDSAEGSLHAFARATGRGVGTVARYSAQWRWRARRTIRNQHLHGIKHEAAAEAAREAGLRLGASIALGSEIILRSIEHYAAQGIVYEPKDLTPFMKLIHDQIALAEGKPTARIEVDTAEQREYLRGLLAGLDEVAEDEKPAPE